MRDTAEKGWGQAYRREKRDLGSGISQNSRVGKCVVENGIFDCGEYKPDVGGIRCLCQTIHGV